MTAETPMNTVSTATRDGEQEGGEAPKHEARFVKDWRLEDAVERALNDLREEGMGNAGWLWKGSHR